MLLESSVQKAEETVKKKDPQDNFLCCQAHQNQGACVWLSRAGRLMRADPGVLPVPELTAALNVSPGEIMKLRKAALWSGGGARGVVRQHFCSAGDA